MSSIQLAKEIDGSSAGYNIKPKPRISNNQPRAFVGEIHTSVGHACEHQRTEGGGEPMGVASCGDQA
jgi:hypothetical protein